MSNLKLAEEVDFFPTRFPELWASEWGEDQYGLWMALVFKNVRQVFRWILPGTFRMGSPDSEKERLDWEIQHQVTLTQGYWLADTACTQALWLAVMSENSSRFNEDENKPVERISWDDVQKFLDQLNSVVQGLDAKLPTEAQWEYACRAGTKTAFSFGDNITPEQVNYNGDYPYLDEKKGLNRGTTVPVKSFPANPWGLYEMHGNIWEWCQGWFGDYSKKSMTNPIGAETGTGRVLRGGSWIYGGGDSRSADRSMSGSADRYNDVGFRFAPGQASCQQAEPQVAASERGEI